MAKQRITFSEAINSVEETVRKIENNELELDQLFAEVKKSTKTLSDCKSKIYKVEDEIKKYFEDMEN